MYEENRKVMKDAAANKTYCSASFMTGDNLSNSTAGGKKRNHNTATSQIVTSQKLTYGTGQKMQVAWDVY